MEIFLLVLLGLFCFQIAEKGEKSESPMQIQDESYILQKDRDEHGRFMNINIQYPQLTGEKNSDLDAANRLIKEAAFAVLCNGEEVEDVVAALEKEKEDLSTSTAYYVEYKILYLGDDCISMVFSMDFCVGGPSAYHDYVVTVDIKNGRYIYFNDYADIDKVLQIVLSGDFVVYEGTCNEVTDEEVHKPESLKRFTKIFREKIYTSETGGNFDRYSSQNIGLDEEYLYIYFNIPNERWIVRSFHGYFILGIPLKSIAVLEEKEQQGDEVMSQGSEFEKYQMLNTDLLGKDFLEGAGEEPVQKTAREYAKRRKGEFVPRTAENGSFPESLVTMLEEIFYNADIVEVEEPGNPYEKIIQEMGGGEIILGMKELYLLFPEIAAYRDKIQYEEDVYSYMEQFYGTPVNCLHIFHLCLMKGQDNYIFVCEGNRGAVDVVVTERTGNEFTVISEFEAPSDKEGEVVCYGDEFYYIFPYSTFNGKECDGVGIYRLADDPAKNFLSIRYLPEEYVWEELYALDESPEIGEKMDAYVEQVKKDMMSGTYLYDGTGTDRIEVYFGDEIESRHVSVKVESQFPYIGSDHEPEHKGIAYQVDLANCGLPVYVCKEHALSYITRKPEFLRARFYFYDSLTDSYIELTQLRVDDSWENDDIELVQMWLKKIKGKVYTFRIYYVSDYSYMMNVALLEKNHMETVRTYVLSPRKAFTAGEDNEQ